MNLGVVIPATKDRIDNLGRVLKQLSEQTCSVRHVVIVCDGWHSDINDIIPSVLNVTVVSISKHEPGNEQPRNVGVRWLHSECTHVWFLDSDCIPSRFSAEEIIANYKEFPKESIFICPYEWMPPGVVTPKHDLKNDPRWNMFDDPDMAFKVHYYNLAVALGNFSGNLVWNIEEFKKIGGFHPNLHMGRCEDGELGLRASYHGVPMVLVPTVRAFHIHHPINHSLIIERNKRDVPLINEWHPWVEEQGLIVRDQDGKRFNFVCSWCGEEHNTLNIWSHYGRKDHPTGLSVYKS